jgi:hypothetical protein
VFRIAKPQVLHAAVAGAFFMGSLFAFAQWPLYLPSGNGKGLPDRDGPAPKSPDGKPDFTGVWAAGRGGGPGPGGPGAGKDKGKGGPPPPPFSDAKVGGNPRGDFKDLGKNMPGGALPYQPAALALRTRRFEDNSKDHPDAHCLPLNPVQLWFHPQPRKLIWNPNEIVMLAESNAGVRQIFTDGRPLPNKDEVQPWWFGYSIGKWDGDTLVIESTGFLDNAWIDEDGSPMSNEAHVTERLRRPNYGTLEVEITVNDPKTYTKPWTVTASLTLMANDELIEFVCGENNTVLPHLVGKETR